MSWILNNAPSFLNHSCVSAHTTYVPILYNSIHTFNYIVFGTTYHAFILVFLMIFQNVKVKFDLRS